ncbi:MAG: hypothetical protein IJU89_02940, partial [Alphaproteobacteria bacterium]|nr:hypothetical protein [Alphaproteobacteria bacterium]
SKSDLQYVKNKSNEGNPKDQCWTKTDPDAYRCCVLKTSEACNAASSKGTNTTSGYVNDFSSFRDV